MFPRTTLPTHAFLRDSTDRLQIFKAEQEAARKLKEHSDADEQARRKEAELDAEWDMFEEDANEDEDEEWEMVTKEEADDRKEMVSSFGSRISALDGGLQ